MGFCSHHSSILRAGHLCTAAGVGGGDESLGAGAEAHRRPPCEEARGGATDVAL